MKEIIGFFVVTILIFAVVGGLPEIISHYQECNTAKTTIAAVNGHVVVWQYSTLLSGREYIARHFIWHPGYIQGVNIEDDGIDINIQGQISDINLYNIKSEEFNAVLEEAKKQIKDWKKTQNKAESR